MGSAFACWETKKEEHYEDEEIKLKSSYNTLSNDFLKIECSTIILTKSPLQSFLFSCQNTLIWQRLSTTIQKSLLIYFTSPSSIAQILMKNNFKVSSRQNIQMWCLIWSIGKRWNYIYDFQRYVPWKRQRSTADITKVLER